MLTKLEKAIKQEILYDSELRTLLLPFFNNNEKDTHAFIQRCLRKMKSRRMLLRTQWYCKIADGMDKVQSHRPALQLVFLIALAEGVIKQRTGKNMNSFEAIKKFFQHILPEDKKHLEQSFRRSLGSKGFHKLTFTSTLKIFYEARNRVVHGEEFWVFFFMQKEEKEKYIRENYTDFGLLIQGYLGKKGRKRRESLDITLTYEEFRSIVIRTAIENIKIVL